MISGFMVKFINMLPDKLLICLSKKILNNYIDKYANIKLQGEENISKIKGPVLFVSNHLSNSDGLVLNKILKEKDPTFVAGIKLSENKLTRLGIHVVKTIPIKPNSADKDAISNVVKTLKDGQNVLIFPEGTRSRTGAMIEGKKGTFLIAKMAKVPIVPIGIWGTEKLLPIDKEDMGNEKFQHADVYVNIGEQIELPKINKDEDKKEYRERAMNYIMTSIAKLIPEEYRGEYKIEG
ncbi:lysophospholipid acyltransferase family protein [Haloimpatiens lingqiaonensis]|uniref:lysophospholipid acyltransferase family protein n=1 Tax=Haloimpatiens lingqiaonensis TaxID=1380675 RepID=UPI0010FEB01F|nr:lysophospholipid acyltransferase family protein [Haloimpatiens lingqiaonensis]